MAILEVREITKNFGGLTALKDVCLSVQEGELRGIIGPNGAGKTTLFNVISGDLKPTGGKVYLHIKYVRRDWVGLSSSLWSFRS